MKYAALTLSTVATALLALALVGIANQIGSGGRALPPVRNALAPLSPQQLGDQVDVQHALRSLGRLPSVRLLVSKAEGVDGANAGATAQGMEAFDGSIFALSPMAAASPVSLTRHTPVTHAAPKSLDLPRVTVVMKSGTSGKAMVNGHLVRVGDAVADGMVVHSISVDSVTFASGKEVLEVRMPLDRLRVLGAFPGSTTGN